MDRHIETYLKGRGYTVEPPAKETEGEEEPGFSEWYETRVLGLDSEAYRRAYWREVYTTGHSIGPMPRTLGTLLREVYSHHGSTWSDILLMLAFLQGAVYPFWLLARLLSKQVSRLRRSTYYERERARRWRLADERIAIRVRRTANPCPTLDMIRTAWHQVHATRGHAHVLAVLRCGALLEDLEGYVDNHAYVVRGEPGIRGRAPGIKGLFREEASDLFKTYKNIMRCKALAKKYRQAVGCPDPVPTSAILPAEPHPSEHSPSTPHPTAHAHATSLRSPHAPAMAPSVPCDFAAERFEAKSQGTKSEGIKSEGMGSEGMTVERVVVPDGMRGGTGADREEPWTGETIEVEGTVFPVLPCLRDVDALTKWMAAHGNTAYLRTRAGLKMPAIAYTDAHLLPATARTEAARMLAFGDGTLVALEAAIALRIDPACVQPACEQGESGVRVRRTAGERRAPSTPRRVRAWLAGVAGLRAREGTAA